MVGCKESLWASAGIAVGICIHCHAFCSSVSGRTAAAKGTDGRDSHTARLAGIGRTLHAVCRIRSARAMGSACHTGGTANTAYSGWNRSPAGAADGIRSRAACRAAGSGRQQGLFSGRYARTELSAGFCGGLVHSVVAEHHGHDSGKPNQIAFKE